MVLKGSSISKVVIARTDLDHAYISAGLDEGELVSRTWPDNHLDGTKVTPILNIPSSSVAQAHSKATENGE